jgi:hypothetical protein
MDERPRKGADVARGDRLPHLSIWLMWTLCWLIRFDHDQEDQILEQGNHGVRRGMLAMVGACSSWDYGQFRVGKRMIQPLG